jgi:cysteine/O-acetylserine efflux protein
MTVDIPATSVFVAVTTFTPGPNNILSASLAAIHGHRRARPFMLGVASGFLVIMLLCATLSTLLLHRLPAVAPVLRVVGALYILWLAAGVYRGSRAWFASAEVPEPPSFVQGFALQFLNPKAIVFGLTVYTTFLAPLLARPVTGLLSAPLLALVSLSTMATWALAGHLVRRRVRTTTRARVVGGALALALAWTAWDLAGVGAW